MNMDSIFQDRIMQTKMKLTVDLAGTVDVDTVCCSKILIIFATLEV